MTRPHEIVGATLWICDHSNRRRAIAGADASSHSMSRMTINRNRERSTTQTGIRSSLRMQSEPIARFAIKRDTEISTGNTIEKINRLWSDRLRGANQITLVFSLFVIHKNDDPPRAEFFKDFRNGREGVHGRFTLSFPYDKRAPSFKFHRKKISHRKKQGRSCRPPR